jgi:hypothetical protein
MNLTYRILWFDDTDEFFQSLDRDPFEAEVKSWGFVPMFELVKTPEEFMAKKPFDAYDLIVVDYNLGDAVPHGEEFIKQIRGHHIFTEIVFYSASPSGTLWDAIQKNQLEGIFVSDRAGILQKLENVAHQSVHKVLDLNNMRGMVMAEVGDMDLILDRILQLGVPDLKADEREQIFGKFHKQAADQAESIAKRLANFKGAPTLDAMLAMCDSYKRWLSFKRLAEKLAAAKDANVGDYSKDVLEPRNFLAHGTPRASGDGYVFAYTGKEYTFNTKVGLELRKTILAYRNKFQEIHSKLTKKGGA